LRQTGELNLNRSVPPVAGLLKDQSFLSANPKGKIFPLNSASADGFEPLSQAFRIHPRGGANRVKITVVVKEKFLCFAAKSQWPAHPFLQCFGDHGAPQSFFRGSLIVNSQ
jgi:hypothetical protein